jgi:ferredoxin-thioredoxin reductase catalytic subunit/rubredoxin
MNEHVITDGQIEKFYQQLAKEAKSSGYQLNPDIEFTKDLIKGLMINENRYGYQLCPCRIADGVRERDTDIICPCDYRDSDLNEYGACYCALYVSDDILKGKKKISSIPERRPPPDQRKINTLVPVTEIISLPLPVWRCKVCGYLCARESPPAVCPICKVKKDRFERFI